MVRQAIPIPVSREFAMQGKKSESRDPMPSKLLAMQPARRPPLTSPQTTGTSSAAAMSSYREPQWVLGFQVALITQGFRLMIRRCSALPSFMHIVAQ